MALAIAEVALSSEWASKGAWRSAAIVVTQDTHEATEDEAAEAMLEASLAAAEVALAMEDEASEATEAADDSAPKTADDALETAPPTADEADDAAAPPPLAAAQIWRAKLMAPSMASD